MNRVAVLGSTGSVGTQALAVARHLRDEIEIVALAGGKNGQLLSRQLAEFQPRLYHTLAPDLVTQRGGVSCSLEDMASDEAVDIVLIATSGRAGLLPALAALRHGKRVALASKEVLVMAGPLIMEAARHAGAELLPVDSEHSAIRQCLQGEDSGISRLLLTASGGPFRDYTAEMLQRVTPADAMAHPVWSMGPKISVDSATLMNKGLEVIEAHWLFGVAQQSIQVLLHPECVVHSMVEFVDGSVKAQLGSPDMALPIQYALTYPLRLPGPSSHLSWDERRMLTFSPVDRSQFPCLRLADEAGGAGKTYPAALCGADEAAVELFVNGHVGFADISRLVACALDAHSPMNEITVDAAIASYDWARDYVMCHYPRICSITETQTRQV
jgi:1-deoxy-D-xylulose-5-phosphate reductoisomerase